jgi:LPXTG-motif cell wall-anchored protein
MQDARTARPHLVSRALVIGGLAVTAGALLAGPAHAAPCEGYSGACATTPGTPPPTSLRPRPPADLENTGAETALLAVIGLGAVSGGTALVVAGRRRTHRGDPAPA